MEQSMSNMIYNNPYNIIAMDNSKLFNLSLYYISCYYSTQLIQIIFIIASVFAFMNQTYQLNAIKIKRKIQRSKTLSIEKIRERGEELKQLVKSSSLKTFIPFITKTDTYHPNKLYFSKVNNQISQKKLPYLKIYNNQHKIKKTCSQKQIDKSHLKQIGKSHVKQTGKSRIKQIENLCIKQIDNSSIKQIGNSSIKQIDNSCIKQSKLRDQIVYKSLSKTKQIPQKKLSKKKDNLFQKSISQQDKILKIDQTKKQIQKQYILQKNTKKLKINVKRNIQEFYQKEKLISFQQNYLDQNNYLKKQNNSSKAQNFKTISENGVLIYQNSRPQQFVTFQRYQDRLFLMQKLRFNPFFRNFKINKFLRLWKCYVKQKNKKVILKILGRKNQFSSNCIQFMLKIRKYILQSMKLQQEWQYVLFEQKKENQSVSINKYIAYMEYKMQPLLNMAKVEIFKQAIFRHMFNGLLRKYNNKKCTFADIQSWQSWGHILNVQQNLKKGFLHDLISKDKFILSNYSINQKKSLLELINFLQFVLSLQISKILSIYQNVSVNQQQQKEFSKINLQIIDHQFKITPFQIKIVFKAQSLTFEQSQQFNQQKIELTFRTIIDNLIAYFSKQYERIYDSQLNIAYKKHYNFIQILLDLIQKQKLTQKQYRMIQEAYSSIDQYKFQNLIKDYKQFIFQLQNTISSNLIINFNNVKLIKRQLQKVLYSILSDLLSSKQNAIASQYYLLLSKSIRILGLVPDYLTIGNFRIIVAEANKKIMQYVLNIKKSVVEQTPLIYKEQIRTIESKLTEFDNKIQLSAWNLENFLQSYKKLLQFKQKQYFIQNNRLPRIKNYLILIHKTNAKMYEECFLQYIEIQRKFDDLKQKKYKFENKITIKIRHIVPQKQMLIKRIENEIQKLQKEVVLITQIKDKRVIQNRNKYLSKIHNKNEVLHQQDSKKQSNLQAQNNFSQILMQIKRIQEITKKKQMIIEDLQLFQNLQIDHCIKPKKQNHFFSFQKLKKQIQYLIKLLESKIKFKTQIQEQLKLSYHQFRIDYFIELIQRQTLKIKHGNRILYQYQTFTIDSFTYYQKFLSFLHILKIIKLLNKEQLNSIENGKYFGQIDNQYTGQKILSFQLQNKYSYLQKLIQKKQFKQNFSKIIQLLNNQIKSIKFQTQFDQIYEQQLFKNLQQLKIQIQNIQDKIQSLKNNYQIQEKSIFIIQEAVQKSSKSIKIILLLIDLQQLYFNLKKIKGAWATQQLIQQLQKQNIKFPIKRSQTNQEQWQYLIKNYKNAYIQCLVEYNYQKCTKQMITLKFNIEKQISFLKVYFQKKREQFPYLYLFKDQEIMSLALSPFNFYLHFYDFIEAAALSIDQSNFVGRLQTTYGQVLNIPIQRYEKILHDQQFSHNINLNLSLNKIHQDLKGLVYKTTFDLWKSTDQKLSKLNQSKLPLSIIYIVDQLKSVAKFKTLINQHSSAQLNYRIIEEEIQQIAYCLYNYSYLSVYQKNLYSTLLLSKLQLRQKLDFCNEERFFNFLTYINKQNKFYLNCYGLHNQLFFNLVDVRDILIIEPITDKTMLNLINCFHDKAIGIVKQINSAKNISSRMLQDFKYIEKQHSFTIQNLIKISSKQPIVFIISKDNFQDQHQFFQFVQNAAQLFVEVKLKLFKLKLKKKSNLQTQQNQTFHLPKLFFQCHINIQTNFQFYQSKNKVRYIDLCLPSYSYLFDLYQVKFSINIPKDIADMIKIRVKLQQQKSLQKNYVFSIKDHVNILNSLFSLFKINNDFDVLNIQEYFKMIENQNQESQKQNKINKNKQRKNRRSLLKKKKIFKDQNTNYVQLIQLFNSIKKSLKLVQTYKQFHQNVYQNERPILLLGKPFLGKTTFYNNYLKYLNCYSMTQKKISNKITAFQKYQINCIAFKVDQNLWNQDFQNIKSHIFNSNNGQKLMIILKLTSNSFPQQIQQMIYKKRITCGDQTMLLSSSMIVIQVSYGQNLSPKLIISSKIILFTQKTLQWEQICINRSQKIILSQIFKNDDQKQIQVSANSENSLNINNPFQIFCLVLSDFFQDCSKKNFFQINFSQKYIVKSTFDLFQSFLNQNYSNIQRHYSNIAQTEKKQLFIRKLFIYCFYWTCYFLINQSFLKPFDVSFKQSLSKHDINVRQIKFLNMMKVDDDKVQYYHIKNFSPSQVFLQGFDLYMMHIDTYETKTYKYFLHILGKSQHNIIIFGNPQSGKSLLIKSWFKENVKNNLIASLNSKKHLIQLNKKINNIHINTLEQNTFANEKNQKNKIKQENLANKIRQCAYVFIDQVNLQTQDFNYFIEWLRQSSCIICQKKYKRISNIKYIIQKELWQVQRNPSLAYHSYPLYIRFQQSHWQNVFQLIFEKIIRNKFANQDDLKQLLKSKSFLIKNLFKFYKALQKIATQSNKTKGFLSIKQHFKLYTVAQFKKSITNLNKFQIMQSKQLFSFLFNSIESQLKHRFQDSESLQKFQAVFHRFQLSLTDQISLNPTNQFAVFNQTIFLSQNKNNFSLDEIQDVFMKKLQYQSNHRSIFISNEIIQNLHKFKYGFQNCSLIICNKLLIPQKGQFPKFAAQWFNLKIDTITSLSELQQKISKKQKTFIFKDQIKTEYNELQKIKQNKQQSNNQIKSQNSLFFFPYSSNSQFLIKQFFQIIKKFSYAKRRNMQSIIQYSCSDEKFKNYLISSKNLYQSHIIYLKTDSQISRRQKFQRLVYKHQAFDGDQKNCKNIINIFMQVYVNILRNLTETFSHCYISSSQNFQRTCMTFIQIYFNKKVELTSLINLIYSGVGQFQNIKQEYLHKINSLSQLKKDLQKSKAKMEIVQQQSKIIKQSIKCYFSSQKYAQKLKKQKIIQKNNQQINSLLIQKNNLKKQSSYYHNQINRNQLAQLKYLYLNSFQIYKELFQSLSLLVSGQQDLNGMKKNILDINLMQKIKEIDFSKKNQELISLVQDKITKILSEKQDKVVVANISQWIYFSTLHQKSLLKYNQLLSQIKKQNEFLQLDIANIQSEANASQKQNKIKILKDSIELYQQEITNLIKEIKTHQMLLILQPQIKAILEFQKSANQVKQQSKFFYDIILAQSLYIAFHIHFRLSFYDEQTLLNPTKKTKIQNVILDQINKRVIFQKIYSQQKIKQALKNSVQNYLDFLFLKKIEIDYENVLKRPLGRSNTKKKTRIRLEQNQKSHFSQKQQIKKNRRVTIQRKKKLKIINYLSQKNEQLIIVIDPKKQLLRQFNLGEVQKILIGGDLSSRLTNNQASEKTLRAYYYEESNGQRIQRKNANIGYLLIEINPQLWEISLNKTKINQKKYQVTIKIQKVKYSLQFEIGKTCEKFSIIILKNKLANLNQYSNKFQIVVFDDESSHQKQLIQVQLMKSYLNSDLTKFNLQQTQQSQNQKAKINAHDQVTNFISGNLNKQNIFQEKLQSIKDMESIFKILFSKQKKFSIFDSQYVRQIYALVNQWKKKKQRIQKLQYSNAFINRFCQNNITPIQNKLFQIYQLYQVYLNLVQKNFNSFNSFEKNLTHQNIHFDFFLTIVSEALEYNNFISKISNKTNQQIWEAKAQQQAINGKIIQQKTKRKLQQNMKMVQHYLIYRLSKQKYGLLFVALVYFKIYCFQNGEGSSIDIRNLFFECKLEQQIQSIFNSKIGLNHVQIFQKFPAFKLQFQLFVKRLMKNIYINHKLVQSDSEINQFIQTFTFENQLIKNQSQKQTTKNQILKLSKFSKLILKKYFCLNYFNKDVSVICQQLVQKCELNLVSYNEFVSFQKIQICFCDIQHQIVWISQMFANLQNNYEIIIMQPNVNFVSINCEIVKLNNSNKPILIFDLRCIQQKQLNLNAFTIQISKNMLKIISDFFDIHRKNCIILTNNSLHQYFHHYQINYKNLNKLICVPMNQIYLTLLNSVMSVSQKKYIQELRSSKSQLLTAKQIIRRQTNQNDQSLFNEINTKKSAKLYAQIKQAYFQYVYMNPSSILHINVQTIQEKLQNFMHLKYKIQQRQLNSKNSNIKLDNFLNKQHFYLDNESKVSLVQIGFLDFNLSKGSKDLYKFSKWTRIFGQKFNVIFQSQKIFKQTDILFLLTSILKSKLKLNAFLQQSPVNKLIGQNFIDKNISEKNLESKDMNNIKQFSSKSNIQENMLNQKSEQIKQDRQIIIGLNENKRERVEQMHNILIDKKQMLEKEQCRLINATQQLYHKIKQLDSLKRKLVCFSEETYLKKKYLINDKFSLNEVIIAHCQAFLSILIMTSHIKLCKSSFQYFSQHFQNRLDSKRIPFYTFNQRYFSSLKTWQKDKDVVNYSVHKLLQVLIVSKGYSSNLNELTILKCHRQQTLLQSKSQCTCLSSDYSFIGSIQIKNKFYQLITKFKQKSVQAKDYNTQLNPISPQFRHVRRKTKISDINTLNKNQVCIVKIKIGNIQFLTKIQCQVLKSKLLNMDA